MQGWELGLLTTSYRFQFACLLLWKLDTPGLTFAALVRMHLSSSRLQDAVM